MEEIWIYQHSVQTDAFPRLNVPHAVIEENLQHIANHRSQAFRCKSSSPTRCELRLTVLWGSMLAMLRARSMASGDGLHSTGVLGSATPASGRAKWSTMSKTSLEVSVPREEVGGFRVSKHMSPSKQSSNPSFFSTLAACALSAFVNTYFAGERSMN